jgi:phage protein D
MGEMIHDLDRGKRRRSRSYVEHPQGEIVSQIAQLHGRSSGLVRDPG